MTQQIVIGFGIILASVLIHALFISIAVTASRGVAAYKGFGFVKEVIVVVLAVLWMMLAHGSSVFMWTEVLQRTGAIAGFEDALYFTMVCYTTLGLGGLETTLQWRLLPGMIAANGFIMFGFTSAFAFDMVSRLRDGRT
ncbi:MAG: ion channel [Pseudomonadota bacterium]